MILRRISVAGFGCYKEPAVLDLPERGIVLITGPNGGGKTTWIDAVAVGLWGTAMRRKTDGRPWSPWLPKRAGAVKIEADGLMVERARSARGQTTLSFAQKGVEAVEWESATHAQRALDRIVGPFDVWRRARVFSGADAAHLSLASDAERKALIEAMLGLAAFDAAVEIERRTIRDRRNEVGIARSDLLRAEREVATATAALDQARAARDEIGAGSAHPPLDATRFSSGEAVDIRIGAQRVELDDEVREHRRIAAFWRDEAEALAEDIARLEAAAQEVARRGAVLAQSGCAACGQAISDELRDRFAIVEGARGERLRAERSGLQVQRAACLRESRAAERRADGAAQEGRRELADLERLFAWFARKEALHDLERKAIQRVTLATLGLETALAAGEKATVALREAVRALATVEAALEALQGTRSAVLSRCLGGIERAANAWLGRFGATYTIELLPTTETKAGTVRDAISIIVHGAGGGQDYGGCSSGERRRIDVALLLALGEVNAAANGGAGSTIFMDEVDGHLDAKGRETFADALRGLARDRCVVVVSHSEDFAIRLRPDERYTVDGGRIARA